MAKVDEEDWLHEISNLDRTIVNQVFKEKIVKGLETKRKEMSKEQYSYLCSTLDKEMINQYQFSVSDIVNIIELKMKVIDSSVMGTFDVEGLYYSIQNKKICDELVNRYITFHEQGDEEDENVLAIIRTISKNNHLAYSFFSMIPKNIDSSCIKNVVSTILFLQSGKFLQLVKSNYAPQEKWKLLDGILDKDEYSYIQQITTSDFTKLIDCVLGSGKCYQERLFLIRYSLVCDENGSYLNQDILKNIGVLPDFIFDNKMLQENEKECENFIKSISQKCDCFVIEEARETSSIHRECIRDTFFDKNFYQLEYMMRLLILQNLRTNASEEELDAERYRKKMQFLLHSPIEGRKGMVSYMKSFYVLNNILLFLNGDYSKEELDKRMQFLTGIHQEFEKGVNFPASILQNLYEDYEIEITNSQAQVHSAKQKRK